MTNFSTQISETSRPFLTWQRIIDWAQSHYRNRTFGKEEKIPARPGLLYLVERGAIRLVGQAHINPVKIDNNGTFEDDTSDGIEEAFLGFIGAGQPFEIVTHSPFSIRAYAHVDRTAVVWMYWHELDNWPHFRREIFEAIRYQHQRKLLWMSTLGQRRTIDRLLGFLTLLIEEYGEPSGDYYCLPFSLTHSQIGSAIGSTRVTVTRLMGKLREEGLISIQEDNLICMPVIKNNSLRQNLNHARQ
ncbi:MAG: Crp/Fnr family transcriptional regulator [Prochloraceae cyanobacterium]